ncbi:IS4 family transposase [Romboutsia sedimentorum]|uniref:IS4 family transposase n=1 Tax=Romboutsia sedimentorum TaxID=1368474 RepID=UPI0024DECAC0|nr:IS4 family transposase [Romboutsia sedimentorum]MDK2587531.1 IS4 family transposase [Romboutsia sedimentorum]
MHKKLKYLIKNLKDVFDIDEINKIAKDTKFVQRRSNVTAKDFLILNVFHGADICSSPLSQLASRYDSLFDTQISKQALDKRFNKHSVEFMKEMFNQMIHKQNTTLKGLNDTLNLHFNRVIINDSTSFSLPKEFKKEFAGSGGVISPSAIKIQLQYELLSGSFMRVDIFSGTKNDAEYLKTMKKDKERRDLKLADLGYFKVEYLKRIASSGSSFISKVKSNTSLYIRNPNPERYKVGSIKKSSEYIKIDILELAKPLAQGKTIELKDIYIGSKKELKSRLIVTKLTEENKIKREITHQENVKKKRGTLNQNRVDFNSINAYITNVSSETLDSTQVHDLYTLRWQIEIMFEVWKSIFKISHVKKVKIERFKCFLYGRLIALLLSSSIVFTAKNIIMEEEDKEISEIKAFGAIAQYLPKLAHKIFKSELCIIRILKRIILNFKRLGIKSRKKHKKTVFDILQILKLKPYEIEKIAI